MPADLDRLAEGVCGVAVGHEVERRERLAQAGHRVELDGYRLAADAQLEAREAGLDGPRRPRPAMPRAASGPARSPRSRRRHGHAIPPRTAVERVDRHAGPARAQVVERDREGAGREAVAVRGVPEQRLGSPRPPPGRGRGAAGRAPPASRSRRAAGRSRPSRRRRRRPRSGPARRRACRCRPSRTRAGAAAGSRGGRRPHGRSASRYCWPPGRPASRPGRKERTVEWRAIHRSCSRPARPRGTSDERLDEAMFRREVQLVLEAGFDHLYVFGTGSEGYAVDTAAVHAGRPGLLGRGEATRTR